MTDWETIISFDSLYKAHRKARLGKRHKKEVIEFETNLAENLWQLHFDLLYGNYKVSGYHNFIIHDPKTREIQAISYRDRIVQHSLCDNYLSPLLERRLVYSNVACRKDKGSGLAVLLLRKYMVEHYKKYKRNGYFVKIDVKKYFENINHTILLDKLKKIVFEPQILELLKNIIDSYSHHKDCGLPMGNQSSQCFALLYLDTVDRNIKERLRIKHYIRYMDDIIVLTENREKAKTVLERVERLFFDNKLILNPKSQIIPVKNGVAFLGWRFCISPTGKIIQSVKQSSEKRIIKKAKSVAYYSGRYRFDFDYAQSVKESYKGHYQSRCPFFVSKIVYFIDDNLPVQIE